jgi:hypothetical protein
LQVDYYGACASAFGEALPALIHAAVSGSPFYIAAPETEADEIRRRVVKSVWRLPV